MEWDTNGNRAIGALAYFYDAGTTTPKAVYEDGDESIAHAFPVEADGGRWPAVFVPFGSYKVIIKTAGGTTLFSADDIPNAAPTDPSDTVDPDDIFQTGDVILAGKNGTRGGFVRLNGRTIGNASSSSSERANADTSDLFAHVWDNFANGQCAVLNSGGTPVSRGASAAADFAANRRITLPDVRNANPFGFGDMGNTDAGLMASAPIVSGTALLAGSIIGANTHTILTAQLPSHTHTGTTASGGVHAHTATTTSDGAHTHTATTSSDGDHNHTPASGTNFATLPGSGGASAPGAGTTQSFTPNTANNGAHTHTLTTTSNGAHTHTLTTTSDGAHTHTFTSDATGSGTAHNIVARGVPFTFLMKL